MSDNSWYEKGELPPVGITCEFMVGNFWKKCEIKGLAHDYGAPIVIVQLGDAAKAVVRAELFRPIKTERELAIEAALKVFNVGPETDKLLFTMAGSLFDAGLLRSKNEAL